ncbi:hypothetical protein WC29P3_00050 [Weissella phage WC29P3]|nr:hypothetical protein WC29P3_00050 [Weissella phage WC29P3]
MKKNTGKITMDNTFIKNYTMMKAHELCYQVIFHRNGKFKGYKGYPAIIYTRFLEAVASGLAMPDYYEYIKTVDPDKFYDFIYKNIEGWLL